MISFPASSVPALRQRVFWALGIIVGVALIVYLGRGGYQDSQDASISFLDALYYSSVSVTTTGYGDITPTSPEARLTTLLLVTPARVIFLVLLLGTTLELLFGKMRQQIQQDRWQKKICDHYVIVGYGVKGKAASERLLRHGVLPEKIVVVDGRPEEIEAANSAGIVGIHGDGSDRDTLQGAGVEKADALLLALDSDDHTLLATLRGRELSESLRIIASCRDQKNAEPLRRAGATQVIVSAGTAGKLLSLAGETPQTAEILEDILNPDSGLDIVEKTGPAGDDEILLAVIQDGQVYRWPDFVTRKPGDRVIVLRQAY